jgi:tRNA(Glu) U13 pseudouridine synthase TruD
MKHDRNKVGMLESGKFYPDGVIKRCNRDFVVCENTPDYGILPLVQNTTFPEKYSGTGYILFNMTKEGLTTRDAVNEISIQLGINAKDISCYGLKDKWAITSQLIAVCKKNLSEELTFFHDRIYLQQIGVSKKPLKIGGNIGNHFSIRVRTCNNWPNLLNIKEIPNYFGFQRFGNGESQYVGKYLLLGKFKKASEKISYRQTQRDFSLALELVNGDYELAFSHKIMRYSTKFFIMQWQSFLFNLLISSKLKDSSFMLERYPLWLPEHNNLYKNIFNLENVPSSMNKFLIKSFRKAMLHPKNVRVSDMCNQSVLFNFDLPSGSYATVVLGEMYNLVENKHGG